MGDRKLAEVVVVALSKGRPTEKPGQAPKSGDSTNTYSFSSCGGRRGIEKGGGTFEGLGGEGKRRGRAVWFPQIS